MAELANVPKAQGDWNLPLNTLINLYNAVGGGTAQHFDDAVTFVNGASGVVHLSYLQGNGFKVIFLTIESLKTAKGSSGQAIMVLPSNLAPEHTINAELNTQTEVTIGTDGRATMWTSDKDGDNRDGGMIGMHLHAVYTTSN